jgi:hypothetical protein
MRSLILLGALVLQAATLPPAYPRPGTTKLFDNDRVQVWNISWLKQTYPLHQHRYDLTGVYYTDGDRVIVNQQGTRRPVSTKAWEHVYQAKGVTHIEEGASESPLRAVFVEIKNPPSGVVDPATTPAVFPDGAATSLRDDPPSLMWQLTLPPASASHRHSRDAVVIAFAGTTPKVSFVPRGTVHASEAVAGADRVYVVELK